MILTTIAAIKALLVPLLLNLNEAGLPPQPATASGPIGTITLTVMRPLWVSETPADTIVITPIAVPVGSYQ